MKAFALPITAIIGALALLVGVPTLLGIGDENAVASYWDLFDVAILNVAVFGSIALVARWTLRQDVTGD